MPASAPAVASAPLYPLAAERELAAVLAAFRRDGYARLGAVLDAAGAARLAARAGAVMQGETAVDGLFYQHDSRSGRYEDLEYGRGWTGPSPHYRKIEGLERDPLFRCWLENALFARIAHAVLGPSVTLYRAVLWNKAPRAGMVLPWHQDDGAFWGIDRPPCLQIWTALDDAPVAAGCVEVVPGSHHAGLASAQGGTVQPDALQAAAAETRALALPVRAGEALLLHNHIWHRSGRNASAQPRRALSVSYLHGATRCRRQRRAPRRFISLFEPPASTADSDTLAPSSTPLAGPGVP